MVGQPNKTEFTFDDIVLVPGKSKIEMAEENQIDFSSQLTKKIRISTPIISSNMATVTESDMAIFMAQNGGIGIIHQFMDLQRQIEEVKKVKSKGKIVGAAIFSYGDGLLKQVQKLAKVGCDVVVIDSANAHNLPTIKLIKDIKKNVNIQVIAGNVVTKEAVRDLIKAGVDGIKVGIGPGSHCTTRIVTGFGRPQLSVVKECAKEAKKYGVPIMSDGGIKTSGDAVKALALGADTVMIGGLLSGTDESPGRVFKKGGKLYKEIWGNCSEEAYSWKNKKLLILDKLKQKVKRILLKRVSQSNFVEEGVNGFAEYQGSADNILNQILGGIRRGIWYGGAKNINELQKKIKYTFITPASLQEAKPRIIQEV